MVVENHKLPRVSYSLGLDNMPSLKEISKVLISQSQLIGSGTTLKQQKVNSMKRLFF
jgi:hypothetical protein